MQVFQGLLHMGLQSEAWFGVAFEHFFDRIQRRVVDAINESHVELLGSRKEVDRKHVRNFEQGKGHKVATLQVVTGLIEGEYRDRPLQTEDLRDLFLGNCTEMTKPFAQSAAARIFLCLQCFPELLFVDVATRKHQQPKRHPVRFVRRRRRQGKKLLDR